MWWSRISSISSLSCCLLWWWCALLLPQMSVVVTPLLQRILADMEGGSGGSPGEVAVALLDGMRIDDATLRAEDAEDVGPPPLILVDSQVGPHGITPTRCGLDWLDVLVYNTASHPTACV